jgi:iron complex transport system permease protein
MTAGPQTARASLRSAGPLVWCLGLAGLALVLFLLRAGEAVPPARWLSAGLGRDGDVGGLVLHYSLLPRLAVAFLCGAALATAGLLFQEALGNPLAAPTTLGVSAGAQLAVTLAVIGLPGLAGFSREVVALAGAAALTAAVFAVTWRRGFASLPVILAGLVLNLACWAVATTLKLVNHEYVGTLFLWGSGSLEQQDWSVVSFLLPRIAVLLALAALVIRPLALLALGEDNARSLGVPVGRFRILVLGLGVMLTATVTAAVGMIGFLELAAPQIARMAGARRLSQRLWATPVIGGALLVIVDLAVQASGSLPTGAATALLGTPILLWLLPRIRLGVAAPTGDGPAAGSASPGLARPGRMITVLAVSCMAAALVATLIGRTADGSLALAWGTDLAALAPWRLPRVVAALTAGAMLAAAGVLLQRLTGNPLAGPEMLGIGSGVAAGLVAALTISLAPGPLLLLSASTAGAFGVAMVLFWLGRRSQFAPEPLVLTGLALSALLDAVVVAFLVTGDFRASKLLLWTSGATYYADGRTVAALLAAAALGLPAALALARWLDLLGLGPVAAAGLGLDVRRARLTILAIAAGLAAAAMMAVGPLSFVGLMAPHMARLAGFTRAASQIAAAVLTGAMLMVLADWGGRLALFPYELPAGLVAALIGLPYVLVALARRR